MRLKILDGFRGYFLLFMMIAHVAGTLNAPIGALSHHSIGWVEDAQGFVFLSGLVVGLVYGKRLLGKGAGTMAGGIWRRVGTLYRYQALLILGFLAATLLSAALTGMVPGALRSYADEPVVFTGLSLLLVGSSMHMGILPMYIFYLLATPLLLILFARGHALTVGLVSVLLWLVAQTGTFNMLQFPLERMLAAAGHETNIGIYFDVLAWQVLYVGGLYAGWLMASDRLDLTLLQRPEMKGAAGVAFAAFLALAIFDVAVRGEWFGAGYMNVGEERSVLSPIYVIAFVIDLFLIAWLLVAGSESGNRFVAIAAGGLAWLMTRPALMLLGRHSLEVFVAHIVTTYAVAIWSEGRDITPALANTLTLVSLLPLFAVAWLKESGARRARALARA